MSYQRQGIDTVSDIINRWAPPTDKTTPKSYIQAVCVLAPFLLMISTHRIPDTLKGFVQPLYPTWRRQPAIQ